MITDDLLLETLVLTLVAEETCHSRHRDYRRSRLIYFVDPLMATLQECRVEEAAVDGREKLSGSLYKCRMASVDMLFHTCAARNR